MKYDFGGHKKITRNTGDNVNDWIAYTCAYCNREVSGAVVASFEKFIKWLQCPNCGCGSVYHSEEKRIHPGVPFGPPIKGLSETVKSAYEEARQCMSVSAYTACELICRNILMYVAVDKGASENQKFAAYIDYLANQGYVTPPMKPWVDLIRQHANKAAHELEPPDKSRAESTITFTAALLKLIYEMEHLTQQYVPQPESQTAPTEDE